MPERIQQRRVKGWRKPENTVSVARPSRFGNPITITTEDCSEIEVGGVCYVVRNTARRNRVVTHESTIQAARKVAVETFRGGVLVGMFGYGIAEIRAALAGRNLMCFCPLDQPCHVDPLLLFANGDPDDQTR